MHKYKSLHVWQLSMTLAEQIYKVTKQFPREEIYTLTSQIRRSVISIPSNIAEGSGRNSNTEFKRFLDIANGSAFELETQVDLARRFGYISEEQYQLLADEIDHVVKMIFKLKSKLNA